MSHTEYPPEVARAAARAFRSRQRAGAEQVRAGKIDRARAESLLRPWAAIACLCGADLPELAEAITAYRTEQVAYGREGESISEFKARFLVALDICPRAQWAPLLESARDRAPRETAEQAEAADGLIRMARFLEWDPAGRRHLRPIGATLLNPAKEAA